MSIFKKLLEKLTAENLEIRESEQERFAIEQCKTEYRDGKLYSRIPVVIREPPVIVPCESGGVNGPGVVTVTSQEQYVELFGVRSSVFDKPKPGPLVFVKEKP